MEIGFALKKLIGVLIMPMPVAMVLIFIGLYLFKKRRHKVARRFTLGGLLVLIVFSTPITSQFFIKPIEFHIPKLDIESVSNLNPQFIVTLGCYHSDDEQLPLVAQIHQCSLPRVVQAAQLAHKLPETQLIFSGYAGEDEKLSDPAINAKLVTSLGVEASRITLIEGTKDTHEEVNKIKELVKGDKFIVISSASHMPRIRYLFKQHGLEPILSPAEYLSGHGEFNWRLFIPTSSALNQSERAIYEAMGNLWIRLKAVFN